MLINYYQEGILFKMHLLEKKNDENRSNKQPSQ